MLAVLRGIVILCLYYITDANCYKGAIWFLPSEHLYATFVKTKRSFECIAFSKPESYKNYVYLNIY